MNPASAETLTRVPAAPATPRPAEHPVHRQRFPGIALLFTVLFAAFLAVPLVRGNPRLFGTFAGVAGLLVLWEAILWAIARRSGRTFGFRIEVVRAHWVQGLVQGSIYVYWATHSPGVITESPLIVAQLVFFYALSALLAWSRGRVWQLGFGPLPIILSTNLLLWFRQDWFIFQFVMITAGALGKEFLRWRRDGRDVHIFNPSVFGQVIVALVLIATGGTTVFTMGEEMAVSFESLPNIIPMLFVLGIIVQYMFAVTLMTFSAVATLCVLNLVYTWTTGSYYFVTLNVGATIFLGMHLLVTDPSTSPRTNSGKVVFGALYALGYAVLFRLFDGIGVSVFWDKLLPVPILNLSVPLIDRVMRSGVFGRWNRKWEMALQPRRMNLVHMALWVGTFAMMMGSGFVHGSHPGKSLAFWDQAYREGRPLAGQNLLRLAEHRAAYGSAEANNVLGQIYHEGKLRPRDPAKAAFCFARACELGFDGGCENVVGQFLFERRANSEADVKRAFDHLEARAATTEDGRPLFLLGVAYQTGRGRPHDPVRAIALFQRACGLGDHEACSALEQLREGAPMAGAATGDR